MTSPSDPLGGFVPKRPPAELRARVLAAARAATPRGEPGWLAQLAADRALRWCAVVLGVLAFAHAWIGGPTPESLPRRPAAAAIDDGIAGMPENGLTAAQQMNDVAPLLEGLLRRNEG